MTARRALIVATLACLTTRQSGEARELKFEMTEVRAGAGGRLGSLGKGELALKDGTTWHSGDVDKIEDGKIYLRFGGKVHAYAMGADTRFCAKGKRAEDIAALGKLKRSAVLTKNDDDTALAVYDDLLLVPLTTGGAAKLDMPCE